MICPNCSLEIDFHVADTGAIVQPSVGDLAVCFNCGERMIVDRDSKMLGLNEAMVREMPPDWQDRLQRIWEDWSRKYSIRGS